MFQFYDLLCCDLWVLDSLGMGLWEKIKQYNSLFGVSNLNMLIVMKNQLVTPIYIHAHILSKIYSHILVLFYCELWTCVYKTKFGIQIEDCQLQLQLMLWLVYIYFTSCEHGSCYLLSFPNIVRNRSRMCHRFAKSTLYPIVYRHITKTDL